MELINREDNGKANAEDDSVFHKIVKDVRIESANIGGDNDKLIVRLVEMSFVKII